MGNVVYIEASEGSHRVFSSDGGISDPEVEWRAEYCTPAAALKKLSLLRLMYGNSKWLEDAERRVLAFSK